MCHCYPDFPICICVISREAAHPSSGLPSSMNHKFKTILSFVLFSSVACFVDLYEFPCLGDPVLVVGFPASRCHRNSNNGFVNKCHRKNWWKTAGSRRFNRENSGSFL